MPAYWFDVFTAETWQEAQAHGFGVSGFSESKYGTVKRIQPGDVLICYLKGAKTLVGALRVVGAPYFAREPRIWQGKDFPARVDVAPIVTFAVDAGLDFLSLLPSLSVYDAGNLRSTWARFQGSPTALERADGELLLAALQGHPATEQPTPAEPVPVLPPGAPQPSRRQRASRPAPKAVEETVRVLADPLEVLIGELTKAQRDASRPARFEQAVARAFAYLGLAVAWHGQPNKTDVVVTSRLGHDRFRAVVDAKASSSGKVPEGQINWPAIAGHRQQAEADFAAIVGERFAGGNLHRFAADFKIALIETEELIEVLRLYTGTPFPAADLRPLFATAGPVAAVVADLRQKAQAIARHWQLVAEIIRLVDDFSRLDTPLVPTTGSLHAVLVSRALNGDATIASPPSEQDVRDAVAFLASRAVGILRPLEPETAGYRLATSEHTALHRLHALEATIHVRLSRGSGTDAGQPQRRGSAS